MVTSDVFQVLKINCTSRRRVQFETLKNITFDHISITSDFTIFIYNILNKIIKKRRKGDRQVSMDTQLCNGFQTAHVSFEPQFRQARRKKNKPKIVLSFSNKFYSIWKLSKSRKSAMQKSSIALYNVFMLSSLPIRNEYI